jgi:hypothetical protein
MKSDYARIISRRNVFIAGFAIACILLSKVAYSSLVGGNGTFTLEQFFGPAIGAVVGAGVGAAAVFAAGLFNAITSGNGLDLFTIARLFTLPMAALFLGSKNRLMAVPALACMALFWMHPEGAKAWVYALYWVIPALTALFFEKNAIARSFGATFTAHAIGSVAFLYAFNMPAQMWLALIPVVAMERTVFALGIFISQYSLSAAYEVVVGKTVAETGVKTTA